MSRSSVMSGSGSQLGTMQLGAGGPQPASSQVQWTGPYAPGEATFLGALSWVAVIEDVPVTVTLAQLERLAASDPVWWVIPG
jgi:hypothetical protein